MTRNTQAHNCSTTRPVRGTRRGLSLLSSLLALTILAAAMAVVLETYLVGAKTLRVTTQRDAVALTLEGQLEKLRAAGYSKLPALGTYPIPPGALPVIESIRGEIAVKPGPARATREVTASAAWGPRAKHREQLTIVLAQRGMNP